MGIVTVAALTGRVGNTALCDGVWLSDSVGLSKPNPAFFRLGLEAWTLPPDRVAYVGDRPDNDIAPARALGLVSVRVRRGPHADRPARSDGERPDIEARDLEDAARYLLRWRASWRGVKQPVVLTCRITANECARLDLCSSSARPRGAPAGRRLVTSSRAEARPGS